MRDRGCEHELAHQLHVIEATADLAYLAALPIDLMMVAIE